MIKNKKFRDREEILSFIKEKRNKKQESKGYENNINDKHFTVIFHI